MTPNHLRRRGRERALQFLFGLEFSHYDWAEALEAFWEVCPTKESAKAYAEQLILGVMERRAMLDGLIDEAAVNWNPERIGRIERNICRIALFEMACGDNVPRKVAINEAVEIVKAYATDDSPKFVNAILDRITLDHAREGLAQAG